MVEVPMSEAQFRTAAERLRRNGIDLNGPSGTLSKDGITARYRHSEGTLRIEILDKPFLLPESLIEGRLRAYLEQSLTAGSASGPSSGIPIEPA